MSRYLVYNFASLSLEKIHTVVFFFPFLFVFSICCFRFCSYIVIAVIDCCIFFFLSSRPCVDCNIAILSLGKYSPPPYFLDTYSLFLRSSLMVGFCVESSEDIFFYIVLYLYICSVAFFFFYRLYSF